MKDVQAWMRWGSLLAGARIEWGGHFRDGAAFRDRDRAENDVRATGTMFITEDPGEYEAKQKEGVPHSSPVTLRVIHPDECSECGRDIVYTFDGLVVRATPPCPYPNGHPVTTFELNVPSGKLVVANDLRHLFPAGCDYDINTVAGCHETTLAYAKIGMAHGFVGNSCPGLYRRRGGGFVIGNHGAGYIVAKQGADYVEVPVEAAPFEGTRKLTTIGTDLWWYSIVDYDEFVRRCEWKGLDPVKALDDYRADIIKVRPGVYQFEHRPGVRYGDGQPEHYAVFHKVRKADPVVDYVGAYLGRKVTVQQVVIDCVATYPTLFSNRKTWEGMNEGERKHAIMRVADHYLCTIGNGIDWHPGGFPDVTIPEEVPDFEIPRFNQRGSWYTLTGQYTVMGEVAGIKQSFSDGVSRLAPDWARLAFYVLESIIRFGPEVRTYTTSTWEAEVERARHVMREAVSIYYGLVEKHPDEVPPDFEEWMEDREKVEHHVATLDYGSEPPPKPLKFDLE
jgi:hypothetical protein